MESYLARTGLTSRIQNLGNIEAWKPCDVPDGLLTSEQCQALYQYKVPKVDPSGLYTGSNAHFPAHLMPS